LPVVLHQTTAIMGRHLVQYQALVSSIISKVPFSFPQLTIGLIFIQSVYSLMIRRFRLPPRSGRGQDDDRNDGHVGKDRPSTKVHADTNSSAMPHLRMNHHRHFQDIPITAVNPTNADQYHQNIPPNDVGQIPTMSSWTVAAGTAEYGPATAWRRHYLDDTRRIQTAPVGQGMPVYVEAGTSARDRVHSIPQRHEVLLSDMRSIYTIGTSVPQSMGIDQQPLPPSMRHMPPVDVPRDRTIPRTHNGIPSSRHTEVPTNPNALPGNSDSQNFVHERFRWRHPNGRIYEQIHTGGQPPIAIREGESHFATRSKNSHSSSTSTIPYLGEKSADTSETSGRTNVLSSDRTNHSHYGTNTFHRSYQRHIIPQDQPLHSVQQYQKNQPPPIAAQDQQLQSVQQYQKNQPPPIAASAAAPAPPPVFEKVKGFDKLDLLCTATLEIGELHDNPTGCSCPKSKCVALYCDCFKAGRRCHPNRCSCFNCKNTIAESGIDGARTKAIRNILARNPRAFNTAGMGNPLHKLPPGEVACNCVRSKCLKLYCSCFHHGKICRPDVCTCVGCENILSTDETTNGNRAAAIQHVIEKRADAFVIKPKVIGQGCACKNNKCLRKYCECYRTGLRCNPHKCTCRDCENRSTDHDNNNITNNYADRITVAGTTDHHTMPNPSARLLSNLSQHQQV
jgi:hypothetical protein